MMLDEIKFKDQVKKWRVAARVSALAEVARLIK
jgi:hypothetical protein